MYTKIRTSVGFLLVLLILMWSGCDLLSTDDDLEGEQQDNHAFSVRQTSDGGFILVGSTTDFEKAGAQVFLVKVDQDGMTEWSHTYGGDFTDIGYSVRQTSDGGYIIAGTINRGSSLTASLLLLKVDADGTEEWTQTFGEVNVYNQDVYHEEGLCVEQLDDGGYIVAGVARSALTTLLYAVRTDAAGEKVWSKLLASQEGMAGTSVLPTPDGGFVITGFTKTETIFPSDMYLVKLDSEGAEVWDHAYGSRSGREEAAWLDGTPDGGFIIAGQTDSTLNVDHYLVKTDSLGIEQWNRMVGNENDDWSATIQQTADGGYILAGTTFSSQTSSNDVVLRKLDNTGEEVWSRTYGQTGDEWCRSLHLTDNGGYIVVGITRDLGGVTYDIWLIRTDSQGSPVWDRTISGE
ncbi:MAG: hypothetical protein JSW54_00740 [Fidelibacterota bacterium]|nr:MAG: hypothetical protein JSW54_00740 [Candidatus Neomarinimicrobiota bacterium]